MPSPKATPIEASPRSRDILEALKRRRTAPVWLVDRVSIILLALEGYPNTKISTMLQLDRTALRIWRERWAAATEAREALEAESDCDQELEAFIIETLKDEQRSGTPPKFTAEQIVQIVAIACEDPQDSGYPVTHWSFQQIATEAAKRGIVESISERQVGRFLKSGRYQTPSKPLLAQHQRKR